MAIERFRGTSEVPLTEEGLANAHQLGQQLAAKGGVDRIMASDLGRTLTTARILNHYTRAPIVHVGPELHPWHLGSLEGTEVTPEKLDFMHDLIRNHPNFPIAGRGPLSTEDGESFNDYRNRILPFFDARLRESIANPTERTALVTHGRGLKIMNAWVRAGANQDFEIDPGEMIQDHDSPGTVMRVSHQPGIGIQVNDVDLHSPTPLSGGVYLIRHENTPWNRQEEPQSLAGPSAS